MSFSFLIHYSIIAMSWAGWRKEFYGNFLRKVYELSNARTKKIFYNGYCEVEVVKLSTVG